MARNRMIKPQFWDDSKIAKISRDARLLYIGMWNFCDDLGVIRADTVWLKSKVFPFDQMQVQQFEKICQEILRNGFISLFSYRGEKFYYLPKFSLHQKINKPNFEDVNVPKGLLTNNIQRITEWSRNNHGLITEQSVPKIEEEIEVKENNYIPPIIPHEGMEELLKKEKKLSEKEQELNIREQELIKREAALKVQKSKQLPDMKFVSDDFKQIFLTWIEYKHERRESYKTDKSLQLCYSKLLQLSGNDPKIATLIVEQSMANNWSGLFKLQEQNHNDTGRTNAFKPNSSPSSKGVQEESHRKDNSEPFEGTQKDYSGGF